ncbi:hypothetical protein OZN62_01185 [Aurantiacibacter sp. MUD11]|uniref:hypothetical protein n=1 Tax=Aurantiacibacter sp. MUD11 TaxID=3003265 RepID=UPI0022AA1A19|nr:hypothetical protein [Aurantiacibacter sp. MUD11]WAT18221.1 hypothetical protein OZN62_01185 [Aurantiacibacter sp. MUD11]
MTGGSHPKLDNISLEDSFVLDVIYDDVSVTLEMEFSVLPGHPRHELAAASGGLRPGFIQFSEVDDLRIKNSESAKAGAGNKFPVSSATIEGDYAFIDSSWGEIELTAQSIRVVVD